MLFWIGSLMLFSLLPCVAQQSEEQKAEILEQQGKFPEAEVIWSRLSSANPRNPGPFAHLGVLEARQNRYESAIKNYRKALALNPSLPGLQVDLGLAYFKLADNKQAIQILKPLAAASPEDQRATIVVGMAYYGLGQYKDAIPYLTRAAEHDSGNLELLLDLGHSCLLADLPPCVLDAYNRIAAVDANSVEAHMLKGETLDQVKDTSGAIQEFQAAVAANPAEPNVHFGLGYLLWTRNEFPQAAAQFKAELANDPGHLQSKLYLADADIQMGNLDDGRRILETLVKANPTIVMAHLDLGIIDSETNQPAEATAELTRALSLDSGNVNAHWRLARLYQSQGMKSQAAKEFAIIKGLNQSEMKSLSIVMSNGSSNGQAAEQQKQKAPGR
jgi:tetratricopeptide (TPR) repeat protein